LGFLNSLGLTLGVPTFGVPFKETELGREAFLTWLTELWTLHGTRELTEPLPSFFTLDLTFGSLFGSLINRGNERLRTRTVGVTGLNPNQGTLRTTITFYTGYTTGLHPTPGL